MHVRGNNGRVSQHTIYAARRVNLEGHKELLGLWLSENEGAKLWLSCRTDLKNRRLQDIFVVFSSFQTLNNDRRSRLPVIERAGDRPRSRRRRV